MQQYMFYTCLACIVAATAISACYGGKGPRF